MNKQSPVTQEDLELALANLHILQAEARTYGGEAEEDYARAAKAYLTLKTRFNAQK